MSLGTMDRSDRFLRRFKGSRLDKKGGKIRKKVLFELFSGGSMLQFYGEFF